ncbi:hypothetical protein [Legionella gresilensis]|uniref:hypothetical protein n=1 Tax=Legionella gresilensis TaxID=91823 RepID=UPI0010414E17|nr:hypothetical protein [Legionella gresilensis]
MTYSKTRFFIWGLLASSRFTPTVQENTKISDDVDYPYSSICNTHGYFANEVLHDSPKFRKEFNQVGLLRSQYGKEIKNKLEVLENDLIEKEHSLFKGHKGFAQIKNYFKSVAEAAEIAKIRRDHSSGFCGEAAAANIVNSLLEQLRSGQRETIQEVTIYSADKSINHVFVLHNSQPLQSQRINNQQLKDLLSNITSPKQGSPIICDEFAHFHGSAEKWADKFFNAKTHNYGQGKYVSMEVKDYSLPSLRDGFNTKQRKYIKESLEKLLSEVKVCGQDDNHDHCRKLEL